MPPRRTSTPENTAHAVPEVLYHVTEGAQPRLGIPTEYNGIRFRSRLEATWAAFFDLLGWPWEYEPFDLEGYVPDFVLRLHQPVLVEVKGVPDIQGLGDHKAKIDTSSWGGGAILVGSGPELAPEPKDPRQGHVPGSLNFGLARRSREDRGGWPPGHVWVIRDFRCCSTCSRIVPCLGSPCIACGDGFVSYYPAGFESHGRVVEPRSTSRVPDSGVLLALWAAAKNRTQWKGEFGG